MFSWWTVRADFDIAVLNPNMLTRGPGLKIVEFSVLQSFNNIS